MDQLVFVIGAASSGTAATVIKNMWDRDEKTLDAASKKYHAMSREMAQKNLSDFLNEFRDRTNRFDEIIKEKPEVRDRIEEALADPDFTVLQMNAMLASARTSLTQAHQILARLVAERLLVERESWRSLTIDAACRAVPNLTSTQQKILAVLTMIYGGRPDPASMEIPPDKFHDWWCHWLKEILSPLLPIDDTEEIDYTHLMANSCCTYEFLGYRYLKRILAPPLGARGRWDAEKFLAESEVGQMLTTMWEKGMQRAYPTSVGRLIGMHVHDLYAGR